MLPLPADPPLFSVIVPTRDRPALLARALRSVQAQREAAFTIIVADDGTGAGVEVARTLLASGGEAFRTGGVGQVPARNMAVRRATGRWIAFLDDDDWWAAPDHLARLAGCLGRGADLAYSSGRIVRETTAGEAVGEAMPFAAHIDATSIRRDNMLLVPGIAYARALHTTLGPFDATLPVYWDWDWYLRLAAGGARFMASGGESVRVSARVGTVSSAANQAMRQAELGLLCAKHGLTDIVLKNHESIAVEQQSGR